MKNIVLVSIDGLEEDNELEFWIKKCIDFGSSMPPKEKKVKKRTSKPKTKRTVL